MAENTMTAERLREAWGRAAGKWRCEAADAFHREYILSMEETAESFDALCAQISEGSQALSTELDRFAQTLER